VEGGGGGVVVGSEEQVRSLMAGEERDTWFGARVFCAVSGALECDINHVMAGGTWWAAQGSVATSSTYLPS